MYVSPHTRGRVSLAPATRPIDGPVPPTSRRSLPPELLLLLVFSSSLLAVSSHVGKLWLLDKEPSVLWPTATVLAFRAAVLCVYRNLGGRGRRPKEKEDRADMDVSGHWVIGVVQQSFFCFLQVASFLHALSLLSATKVILFAQFIELAIRIPGRPPLRVLILPALLTLLSAIYFDNAPLFASTKAYTSIALYGLCSLSNKRPTIVTAAQEAIGAACMGVLVAALFNRVDFFDSTPELSNLPLFIALALSRVITPYTARALEATLPLLYQITLSYVTSCLLAALFAALAFRKATGFVDVALFGSLLYTLRITASSSALRHQKISPSSQTYRLMKTYLSHILNHPESRRIFLFLLVNLAFMFVQMVYGVWTNSLGLISDAIHMAFDCLSIALGLTAAVMAKWRPNERFTYGYGRIETLSGFANGIFLILISIFIVFEAIQRLLDPPEMDISQLLLVSSLGLAVNLFGMYATGGHHHHGHGHGHAHNHQHPHVHDDEAHHHEHEHGQGHGHGHGPSDHLHEHVDYAHRGHNHQHDEHAHSNGHELHAADNPGHSHSHTHAQLDGHGHDHNHVHEYDHNHHHDHEDGHSHSHTGQFGEHGHHGEHERHNHDEHHNHSAHGSDEGCDSSDGVDVDHDGISHSLPDSPSPSRPHAHRPSPIHLVNGTRSSSAVRVNMESPSNSPSDSAQGALDTPISLSSPVYERHFVKTPAAAHFPHHDHVHDENCDGDHEHEHHDHTSAGHAHGNSRGSAHAHSHDHHGHSHNMRGVFLHVMADTLGSVGVIISTLLIQFYGWNGFDPIASIFIAVLIAASVIPLVIDAGRVLALDVGDDREGEIRQALSELSSVEGLASFTAARFWPKDADKLIGTIHIQLAVSPFSNGDPGGPHSIHRAAYADLDRVFRRVESVLKSKLDGLEELSIQVEGSLAAPFCSCTPRVVQG